MDVINSFFNNIRDKLTNPFFGTLILVMIIDHWELWYTVFNFDSEFKLADKVFFIKNYAINNLDIWSFLWNVLIAILFMLLGYLIIVATRSLVLWVEYWLMPLITDKIVNENVVLKSEYDVVLKEREEYFDQYEEQRKNVRSFSKTIDEQTEQIKQKDQDILKQSDTISNTIRDLDITKKKLENTETIKDEQTKKITRLTNDLNELQIHYDHKIKMLEKFDKLYFSEENKAFYTSYKNFPPEVVNKVLELKNEGLWDTFMNLGKFYQNGGTIGGDTLTTMINKGIAFERGSREDFTPVGNIIWRYRHILNNV